VRYLTWKLTWPGDAQYGVGPEPVVAENGGRLEASSWVNPTVEAGTILGYLIGDVDLGLLADWDIAELTEAEALAFAQAINSDAFMLDDGQIGESQTDAGALP
jgi:hypothetical protein